ncbi:MAG TPA: IPT/TIG domain-containing protein [Bryobacteraceae bacterium]|nr:IPT/TIG domain-containing protein [Bryobacteraceae bacterium]
MFQRCCWILAILSFGSVVALGDTPTVASVLNGVDFTTHLSPGVLATIYGNNFGSSIPAVSVSVGGRPGYIIAVSPNQINAQIPTEASTGSQNLIVTVAGSASAPFAITLDAASPAFFTLGGAGSGVALAFNAKSNAMLTSTAPAKPGDAVSVYLTGLGATTPPTPTGIPAAANPTSTLPTLTVGGQPATVTFAGVSTSGPGAYQVNFTVPSNVQGLAPLVLTIGGKSTNPPGPVVLMVFGITSIVNNASFGSLGTAAPGSIVTLFGNGFGTTSQTTGFPSTAFQGVSVTFNGTPAPLFHLSITAPTQTSVGQSQIDLLVPYELPTTGTVQVAVKTPSGTSPNYPLTMVAASPGMYNVADPSTKGRFNILAQFNGTAWLDMPASMATALKLAGNCAANNISPLSLCGQPAAPGDYLVLYATGLGLATPNGDPNGKPLSTGSVPPADGSVLYETVQQPIITVGGLAVTPIFSGLAPGFPGLYQVDFQVPAGVTGDDVPVVLGMPGSATDSRTMSIQPKVQPQ